MPVADTVPVIVHAIQLAVAPVFLLTGAASLPGVMASRLARIIDRARYFEQAWPQLDEPARADAGAEPAKLDRRRHLAGWSINFCTAAALLVCLMVTALFADAFFTTDLKALAGVLFGGSMLALIAGLASYLREGYLATETVHFSNIGAPH